jgi:hypothetical protein
LPIEIDRKPILTTFVSTKALHLTRFHSFEASLGTYAIWRRQMIDPNTQGNSPLNQEHAAPAADRVPETFLAFMAKLLGAFTAVDPRVITP